MIVLAWSGFPQYAARCVGALVSATTEHVIVVATRPRVPVEGMERVCGCTLLWHNADETLESFRHELPAFDANTTAFCCGWHVRYFNELRDAVKRSGGKAILMNDANYIVSAKTLIQAVRFRLLYRWKYNGVFVPGKSGHRLALFYGVKESRIQEGMYVADPSLFRCEMPLCDRPKEIIYVGQFINRKNVLRMCRAFVGAEMTGWKLRLYGSGPLRNALRSQFDRSDIEINDFAQPEKLSELYQSARVSCLPSLEEHWGVVVHEAALSGCYLLLSKGIGASDDFLGNQNGLIFDPESENEMVEAFRRIRNLTDAEWRQAMEESLKLARHQNFDKFVSAILRLSK